MFKRQSGITLIELVMTIVILAIALVGVTAAISNGIGQSANTLLELKAVALGQAYLDEITGKRFDENSDNTGIPPCRATGDICTAEASFGPDGGAEPGNRDRFDDVDDYHGLDEGDGQANPLQDAEGNPRTGYDNFRVQVNVRYINVGAGEEEDILILNSTENEFDAKLITVTVLHRNITQGLEFSTYKANF